jgi:dTDP-glucose 4,6-dehydratase
VSNPIIITGGCGFIGSALVRKLMAETDEEIIVIDKLTYAHDPGTALLVQQGHFSNLVDIDVCDTYEVRKIIKQTRPRGIIHLAAETHVDRSINGPNDFIETNVVGTYSLLEAIRANIEVLPTDFRLLHCSTDEVFGDLPLNSTERFNEESPYRPSSPYSASKAAADHMVRAWGRTWGLPFVITHCTNNYGPRQTTDKLVPVIITSALGNTPVPIHGTGRNVRDWLYVEDHTDGLWKAFKKGRNGHSYCFSSGNECSNFDMIQRIGAVMGSDFIATEFVKDRPGNDLRYSVSNLKAAHELDWRPQFSLFDGLAETVRWYKGRGND